MICSDLSEALRRVRSMVLDEEPFVSFHLHRSQMLYQAMEELDNYEHDPECLHSLRVVFVDKSCQKEAGIDIGVPSREFACGFN